MDGLSFLSIDTEESNWLERDFEKQEVWEVVRDLNDDKTLGLDGFTMAFFFGKCWEVMKQDIMAVLRSFIVDGSL